MSKQLVIDSLRPLPQKVSEAGTTRAKELDVQPVLASGGDPFRLIMKTIGTLPEDEALLLIASFEPIPLYSVMQSIGRNAYTEQHLKQYHVWFYRDPELAPPQNPSNPEERAPLQEPVLVDVRGMEPPNPMITILEKLVDLGPGAQLIVHHHREPVLLYDKLELRAYQARTTKRGEGDYLIRIAPKWAFDDGLIKE